MSSVRVHGEALEVALAEAQAVRAMARDDGFRDRLASVTAALSEGEVEGEDAETLEQLLELALQSGRLRAVYGPGGEQATLRLYRSLPRGRELGESAAAVSEALSALAGRELQSVSLSAVGPGAYTLSIAAGEVEVSVRLDRQGARLTSLGV